MPDLSAMDPTGRFSRLAEVYAKCRPDYPPSAIEYILGRCGLEPGDTLIDVGSGTGISARQFAARGLRVLGVEPNDAMRRQAEAEPVSA